MKNETVKHYLEAIKTTCPKIDKRDLKYIKLILNCVYSTSAYETLKESYERKYGKKI